MNSDRDLVRSIAIIVGSFLIGGALLLWLRTDLETQAMNVQDLKSRAATEGDLLVLFTKLKNQSTEAQPYEQHFNQLLPNQDKLIDFRAYLEALASQRGVVTNFSFDNSGTPGKDGSPGTLGFSLEVSGPLSGIEGLLQDIEVKPQAYLLTLDDFSLGQAGSGYRASFHGSLFYR